MDLAGHAYVTGSVSSKDFPLANPLQDTCLEGAFSCLDAFVAKLSPDGSSLVYSTYLGGSSHDGGSDIAIDSAGNAFVGGFAMSADFPTVNPIHGKKGRLSDGFIAKLNPEGSALVYSTFLGGTAIDAVRNIAVDLAGNACVTGSTESADFPTFRALQPRPGGGAADAFVAKLDAAGSKLIFSTYLGGSDIEDVEGGIAVDGAGSVYVAHSTLSRDFPTANAFQPTYQGGDSVGDAFVAKIGPGGQRLLYSTYLGGSDDDGALDIAVDAAGSAYVTGFTMSENFPVANATQPFNGGGLRDVFVTKLTPSGSAPAFSTYLGGPSDSGGWAIALGPNRNVYVTGQTEIGPFPRVDPLQPVQAGMQDAFVARYTQASGPSIQIQPEEVAMGSVTVGTASDHEFHIHDEGDAALTVFRLEGISEPLELIGPAPRFRVGPGRRRRVQVRWLPQAAGPFQAVVRVISNDKEEPVAEVLFVGTAVAGAGGKGEK